MNAQPSLSPSAPDQPSSFFANPKRERNFLLLLAAMQFTHIVDFMILMPMGPQLMKTFALTPAHFGSVVSAYTFSAGIAGILAALFLDRLDRKITMLIVYFGFILGTVFCGLAPNAHVLMIGRIISGGFGGVMVATVFAMISDVIPMQRRGYAMGIVMTAFSVASIAGVPIGLFLSTHLGWQIPFFALSGLSLVMWFAGLRLLPRMRRPPVTTNAVADLGKILSVPIHWRAFLFTFAMMGSTFLVIPYISAYLVSNADVLNTQLPWVFFTGGLATFFTLRWFGKLGDKLGLARVYGWASLCAIVPVLLVTHQGAWGIWFALPVTTLFMIFVSGRAAPGMALVTTVVEPRLRGGFMSLNTAVQQLASGAASLLAGLILVAQSDGTLRNYGLIGWMSGAGLVLSIWLANGLKIKDPG
jgi:predicted MFS family arabinose efflux permease